MKQKTFILLIVGILVFAGSVGGAFASGVAVGKNQSPTTTFQRGQFPGGITGSTTFPGGGNGAFGRGTMGTVEKVDGNTITIKTIQGTTVNVITTTGTTYRKTGDGSLSDVTVGQTVSVSGTTGSDGSVTATTVTISPDFIVQPTQAQ